MPTQVLILLLIDLAKEALETAWGMVQGQALWSYRYVWRENIYLLCMARL